MAELVILVLLLIQTLVVCYGAWVLVGAAEHLKQFGQVDISRATSKAVSLAPPTSTLRLTKDGREIRTVTVLEKARRPTYRQGFAVYQAERMAGDGSWIYRQIGTERKH